MKIWVVDNGSQWTHREWRVLRYLKQDTQIVDNKTPVETLLDNAGVKVTRFVRFEAAA